MIKTFWTVKHYNSKGDLLWQDVQKKNSLANQGASAILQIFYQKATNVVIGGNTYAAPTNFYVRLCNYSPLVTDTLITIQNEPTTNFYNAQQVPASVIGYPTIDTAPDGNIYSVRRKYWTC